MKKIIISVLTLMLCSIIGFSVGMLSKQKEENSTKYGVFKAKIAVDLDEVLDCADVIVSGKVKKITKKDLYYEYVVEVQDVKKGEAPTELIVRNYTYNYSCSSETETYEAKSNTAYEEGKKYIFVLQHMDTVYEEAYMIIADTYMPIEDEKSSTLLARSIENVTDVEMYIDEYDFDVVNDKRRGTPYIKSESMDEIILESMYVTEVTPVEMYHSTDIVDVYLCNVNHVYKGNLTTTEDDQILISFFKDSVKKGEEYIVALNSDTDDALIYALSSKKSVYTLQVEEEIRDLLEYKKTKY